ncbi:MAG TPA: hypothetical protein VH325_10690 [Bryobacteraceae bacterium]|nr:hypothetical protein [Bryobacteraceae bacterium]
MAKGSSALKIVLVVVCVLAVVGVSVVGGMLYLAHRVKQAIVQKAAENGLDLHSLGNTSSGDSDGQHKLPPVCGLLTKDQVSHLIGEPIERTEIKDASCLYYGPAGLSAQLAQQKASSTFNRAQTPGSDVNASEAATAVDQLVNNMAAQAGQTESGSDLPLLMVSLDADGAAQMTAIMASKAIFSGLGQSANGKLPIGSDVPGLGDKAVFMPKLGLNVLQGGTFLRIIPGPFPDSDAKTIAVARAILPKI